MKLSEVAKLTLTLIFMVTILLLSISFTILFYSLIKQSMLKTSYIHGKRSQQLSFPIDADSIGQDLDEQLQQEFGYDLTYVSMVLFAIVAYIDNEIIDTVSNMIIIIPQTEVLKSYFMIVLNLAGVIVGILLIKQLKFKNSFIKKYYSQYQA